MAGLMVVPVLIQLFVIGYALTTEVRHVPMAAVDRCRTPDSRALLRSFTVGDLFDYGGEVSSERELRALLDNGSVRIGLVVPATFARDLQSQDARVQLLVDGQDANSAQVAAGYARAIVSRWSLRHAREALHRRGIDMRMLIPVDVTVAILHNPLLQSAWYMIPGLVVLLVTLVTSLLTALSLVREKERGTLEQLLVTPIGPVSLLAGKIVPFILIGLIEISIFLVLATLWFQIPLHGSLATLFLFALIYMVSCLGIGILTSTIARNSQQVLFITYFVMIFFILLSGWFIPVENMPDWVQTVTNANPVRFFLSVVRDIFLKGLGIADMWREAVAMLCIGACVFALALATFKRRAG
jgi:ABC-2 type transport system permease protein